MKIIKEACVGKLEQAKMAEYYNADRVEICSRLDLDGLTPDRPTIEETISSLSIPVKVMIRPKSDNFIYSDLETIKMESDIAFCKEIGVSEVVFGMLNEENHIDIDLTHRLAKMAFPMNITFHKAIDHTGDIMLELKRLCKVKEITSILTSGGKESAINGQDMIKDIIHSFSSRFNIIVAGGITEHNFDLVHSSIGAKEYHGREIVGQLKSINK